MGVDRGRSRRRAWSGESDGAGRAVGGLRLLDKGAVFGGGGEKSTQARNAGTPSAFMSSSGKLQLSPHEVDAGIHNTRPSEASRTSRGHNRAQTRRPFAVAADTSAGCAAVAAALISPSPHPAGALSSLYILSIAALVDGQFQ